MLSVRYVCHQTQIFTWVMGIQNQILMLTQHIILLNEPSPPSPQVSFEIYNYHPKHGFIFSFATYKTLSPNK